jgi:hypothetical protein
VEYGGYPPTTILAIQRACSQGVRRCGANKAAFRGGNAIDSVSSADTDLPATTLECLVLSHY